MADKQPCIDERWVLGTDIESTIAAAGVKKKMLAYCKEMMCVENTFEAGAIGALHSHPHTQVTYVAEGEFEFTIGDEKKVVKKGDTMLKKDGIKHGCVCLKAGVLVDFFTPMREDFLSAD
ncbi:MAG: cupin domain-containing protein [Clostridiales bacterium]|jgi:quercetin dioxygenase-like cupin family protein|nr:cupin domain-containing protein [Clostridiales bacterium]